MNNKRITLDALRALARFKWREAVTIQGEAFIIEGIRLFIPANEWRGADAPKLLQRLDELLSIEKQARMVSETKTIPSV